MKKGKLLCVIGAIMVITGCTPQTEIIETTAAENVTAAEEVTAAENVTATEEVTTAEETEIVLETETASKKEDDNFSADEAETENFAGMVKEAVVQKDLEKLAELAAFPMYIGFPDGGKSIDSKEAFLAFDPEMIFTVELMDSVAEADEKNLPPSRAGFILTKEAGGPNVIFGLRDGTLAVTGINY